MFRLSLQRYNDCGSEYCETETIVVTNTMTYLLDSERTIQRHPTQWVRLNFIRTSSRAKSVQLALLSGGCSQGHPRPTAKYHT